MALKPSVAPIIAVCCCSSVITPSIFFFAVLAADDTEFAADLALADARRVTLCLASTSFAFAAAAAAVDLAFSAAAAAFSFILAAKDDMFLGVKIKRAKVGKTCWGLIKLKTVPSKHILQGTVPRTR